jgi:DNA-binding NarL/FixJ family response regulator
MLIDDHALFRDGMALMLQVLDSSVEIQHANSAERALQLLREGAEPELILLDMGLPGVGGLEAMRLLRAATEKAAFVVLSGTDDMALVRDCIDAGAMGFVHKAGDAATMRQALRQVLDGRVYLPEAVEWGGQPSTAAPTTVGPELTPRQREVLQRVVRGATNKAIALDLGISETTVKTHLATLMQLLGASTRTEAVYTVRKLGIRFS